MRLLRTISAVLLMALPATAQQDGQNDKTYLEGLIEGLLSDTGRTVTVTGFEGALSSNATLESLTIADEDGVWFILEDAALVWSRAALLQGRLDIDELTAGRVELVRLPEASPGVTPEDSVARPFALPELPVTVELDELRADLVELGPTVLGEVATLTMTGSLLLAEGSGDADLDIRRTDRQDSLVLRGGFANETRVLAIDVDFVESAGGLVSRALNIPGTPALGLRVTGDAPLDEFEARVALSSDGARRFGGVVRITSDAPTSDTPAATGYLFDTRLAGDLRPLFTEDLHPFVGEFAAIEIDGKRHADGALDLDALRLVSGGMEVTGALALAPDGWPSRFDLSGEIGGSGQLRLPVAGPATGIERAVFEAAFDAAQDDAWSADITVTGLDRPDLSFETVSLRGEGQIRRAPDQSLSAVLRMTSTGVVFADPALSRAVGPAPGGTLRLGWRPGAPLQIEDLTVTSQDTSLIARGTMGALADGLPVTGRAALRSEGIDRFAALAKRPLSGAVNSTLQGTAVLLSGAFDIEMAASARDLRVGEPRLDPLMAGRSTLSLVAGRDETGTRIDALSVESAGLKADAGGRLNTQTGALALTADLTDLALSDARLSGPARIETELGWQADGTLTLDALRVAAMEAVLTAAGTVNTGDPALPAVGRLTLDAKDLSRLSRLTGRDMAGRIDLSIEGNGALTARRLDAAIALTGEALRTGAATLDRVLAGSVTLDGEVAYGNGLPLVRRLDLKTPRLTAIATSAEQGAPGRLTARLSDMGLVAPGLNGPAQLDGQFAFPDASADAVDIDMALAGPAGMAAQVTGRVGAFGRALSLGITGSAPLGLANGFIAPRSVTGPVTFDLRMDGPPALSSLTGQARISQARAALPTLGTALTDLTGTVAFANGQATTDITGSAGTGGSFRLRGPIALAPPFQASVEVILSQLGFTDPTLYATTLNGTVGIAGPLAGGAQIAGNIALGPTELRVPSGTGHTPDAIPEIRHIAEPAAVAKTRRRAGLTGTTGRRAGAAYPIDLTIDAPNRIFVRGRGLDAELGGQLRLQGTTANVAASGVFELIRGRIDVLTKRLELTEGLIDMRGALDPYVRFVAKTRTDDYEIDVVLEGLASAPTVTFTSVPDLPQEEIIAQLLFGRSFADMSALQAAQLVGAFATLSGRGSGGLTGRLRTSLGLSDFDVTSTADGATQFSVGAYISENIYSEITADSEGNNEINLNLDLTPSVTVRGSANNSGETGLGIFFEKDY